MKKFLIATVLFVAVCGGVLLATTAHIKSQNEFKVTHFQEVKSEYGPDGRAAVGSPEVYQVRISPALTWSKSANYTGAWRTTAWIVIILAGLYGAGAALEWYAGNHKIFFVALGISLACTYGAYSSAYSNNYKELSKEQYFKIKDDPAALKALFDKPMIR